MEMPFILSALINAAKCKLPSLINPSVFFSWTIRNIIITSFLEIVRYNFDSLSHRPTLNMTMFALNSCIKWLELTENHSSKNTSFLWCFDDLKNSA